MRLLVLGGIRSGKSAHAESVAAATDDDVVYVATARRDPGDDEMAARIETHRERRPTRWVTEETEDIVRVLADHPTSTVLVDDLGGWLTRRMDATLGWTDGGAAVAADLDALVTAVAEHSGTLVLVSPEVGLGVVPDTLSGRVFADVIGSLNRRLAGVCDSAVLVVAGRPLPLEAVHPTAGGATRTPDARTGAAAVASGTTVAAAGAPEAEAAAAPRDLDTVPHDFPGLGDVSYYDDPVAFPPVHPPSHSVAEEARARHLTLTKPATSLGRLEELSVWVSSCQEACPPRPLDRARVVVFAGDHGVAEHGVSAFPREVTLQMADNIVGGGAAVSVLARMAGATVRVADMAMSAERPGGLDDHKIRRSSGSIDREDALTPEEVRAAIAAGRRIADEEVDSGADLLIAGDLGIGNTTPATVLTCLVTGREPVELVGRGTGIDDEGWMRKTAAIRDAMFRASGDLRDPVAMLRKVGGADLAAMAGFLAQAAIRKTPCLLDGSVVTSAALMAEAMAPGSRQWWAAGHRSAEPAHTAALTYLSLDPILEHSMRLGEGSGAVAALPVVHNAVAILTQMATFADAGVAGKD
ncbi:nicotinate-nucleotide--dimethylbenzimidazole phosphoribosyltransferase [Dietzia maris]|jgi:nicotinate-nucleotide--dimethylbenzimidazole phosphoribosyltransferase|uniref:nicotinate-nucleotide--dimethylbenzimidazole phosphoribosyltransferase n=1 Tax=Dietzia TaxID=37914 RepID=UPI0022B4A8F2|nr:MULTISPECIES: nicotinate-nucleotide--dimethylbenzimidazole phosphoribosyltransferase [Dietzia]MCZ4541194.1 nicotinate-nucleotide--dimethylbenzimidazole phosphoribosyltransferase [Dietzia maris]MCZ4656917.1 nicotinate-nucleotide--dimethylbenzimidazole phosphoribosyltransferase [Dietzia kunjamensis]MDJ0423437.1 nicotinate-nucleotide--dimethylbenzimidazole phosphoribosyltransferase [Dietzia kunjamensis]MDV3355865.1 nicotinate-nucleotide--dimethylbenzimidazole phosphoribosyltransferase [Dietzia 